MRVTTIIRQNCYSFFGGIFESDGQWLAMSNKERLLQVLSGHDYKVGKGGFRDRDELDMIMRGDYTVSYRTISKTSLKLAIFEVQPKDLICEQKLSTTP